MRYKDASLPVEQRVEDLLAHMSVEDKIAQLGCLFYSGPVEIDWEQVRHNRPGNIGLMIHRDSPEQLAELLDEMQKTIIESTPWGIPALIHIEAITGGLFAGATSFPNAVAQASTWNPALLEEMTGQVRRQLRAVGFNHALSPVFDICRDPRWGRLTESYGEDETLASAMAVAFVRGLQGEDEAQAVAATGKHFVGHGVTEGGLNMAQNPIGERELREVHCKPFQAAMSEAGLMAVMNSYCTLNREAIIGSKRLLTGLLREEMGFEGLLVSDYASIDRLLNPFQVAADHLEAGVLALKAGMDVEYPAPVSYNERLKEAVADDRLDGALIDRSARRVLALKFRLGLFEKPYSDRAKMQVAFGDPLPEQIGRRMAAQAATLLKNEGGLLPLDRKVKRVAVVGPHADRVRSLFGHYTYAAGLDMNADAPNNYRATLYESSKMPDGVDGAGDGFYQRYPGDIRETPQFVEDKIRAVYPAAKSLYEAVRDYLPEARVAAAEGITYTGNHFAGYGQALDCAADADVVILTLGGQNGWGVTATNGEGIDNANIGLPGKQEQFARDIRALNKPTVVVHIDGKPLSSEYVASHFDAIVEAWQLGQYGFEELVRMLFGEISPSGRLPLTVARGADRLPAYYGMPRGSGYVTAGCFGVVSNRFGYVNDTAHPLYHFGHGLSYTSFAYSNLNMERARVPADGALAFTVEVANTGGCDGDEVVQVYVSDVVSSMVRPCKQLVGFHRVPLRAGERKTLHFALDMSQLAFLDEGMEWKVEGGEMRLLVGASSEDIRLRESFVIEGDRVVDPKTRAFCAVAREV